MGETIVYLARLPETSERECLDFLRCLYSHLEHGPDRDKSADAEREVHALGGLQPVTVTAEGVGEGDLDTAIAAVSAAAQACDPDWPRLYRFTA